MSAAHDPIGTRLCLCAVCDDWCVQGDALVDHFVFKCGELDEIELAHKACAPQWERTPEEEALLQRQIKYSNESIAASEEVA